MLLRMSTMPEPSEQPLAIVCDGGRLAGGACVPESPRGTVVLLHGIPSAAPPEPDDTGYPGLAREFAARGWAAVWANMRAVRGSPGFFSIEGWVRDARAIVDAARALPEGSSRPLALVGSSAGGAVSVEATVRGAPVDALVLLASPAAWLSFASGPGSGLARITDDAGMALAPEVLEDPTEWLAEFTTVSPERTIGSIKVPTLIVHGTADDVVPVDHGTRLADRATSADVRIIEGLGHQLRREPEVIELVDDWLRRALR
jgi:alpha-beta hydrolase superfamily lysophospholipase